MAFQIIRPSTIEIQTARDLARTNLLQFTIAPNNGASNVYGILKNKPKFSIEAQYDRLINMDEDFAFLNKIGGLVGVQVGLTKGWTTKIFKGGSYLEISLTARIIEDGKVITDVVSETKKLVSLANPIRLFSEGIIASSLAGEGLLNPNITPEERQEKKKSAFATGQENISKQIQSMADGFATNSPPLCTLYISNFFELNGFYVKSVSFEFSHEQTVNGPLYSDIDIELTHSQVLEASQIKRAFK